MSKSIKEVFQELYSQPDPYYTLIPKKPPTSERGSLFGCMREIQKKQQYNVTHTGSPHYYTTSIAHYYLYSIGD